MYFKAIKLHNFRKFRTNENVIELQDALEYIKKAI